MRTSIRALLVVVAIVAAASTAYAQKSGRIPPGQLKRMQQSPGGSGLVSVAEAETIAAPSGRVRTLGAWLDDATVLPTGEAWLGLSLSRWAMPIATGSDAPAIDASVGVGPRVHTSMTVPYFRATDRSGARIAGVGDMYFGAKLQLSDPETSRIGVAVAPTLEVMSTAGDVDPTGRRLNVVLPLNLEWRGNGSRVYGSTGYFSRGVVSTAGAIERWLTDRAAVTAALTHSYATDDDALSEEIGLRRHRVDVLGTMSYVVSPALVVFGSLGRTLSALDDDSTRMMASGGVSVNVVPRRVTGRSGRNFYREIGEIREESEKSDRKILTGRSGSKKTSRISP